MSYRNDGDAPRSDDYRYALGDREWRDIEPAMQYALDHGAEELVLMGWSMGGATVLQALTRSPLADTVHRRRRSNHRSSTGSRPSTSRPRSAGFPAIVRWGVQQLFRQRWGGLFTGLAEPLDLDRLDFVRRARELDRPVLILHSDDDGFVPSTASRALAVARPDIVTYEAFEVARHTKLWNYDRDQLGRRDPRLARGSRYALTRYSTTGRRDFSRTCRWMRPSSAIMPRIRSGLTASVSPIVSG